MSGLDDAALAADRERFIKHLFGLLADREAAVLRLRHGLDPAIAEPLTLDAIGQMFGLTRERIRQIESKALKKIYAARASPLDDTELSHVSWRESVADQL